MARRKTATARGGKNLSHKPGRADKHTSNKDRTSSRGAVSTVNSISHSWIFFFLLSGFQSSFLLIYFREGLSTGVHTAPRYGTNPVRYTLRRSTFEIGAVQHRSITEIARHNRSYAWTEALYIYPVWFSYRRKSYYPVKCEHNLSSISL